MLLKCQFCSISRRTLTNNSRKIGRKDRDVNIKRMIRNQWEAEKQHFSTGAPLVVHTAIVMIAMVLLPTILVLDVFKIPYEHVFWTHLVTCLLSWVFGIATCFFAGGGTLARLLCYFWGFAHLMIATSSIVSIGTTIGIGFVILISSMIVVNILTEVFHDRFLVLYHRSLIW